jgi:hypothetical protein
MTHVYVRVDGDGAIDDIHCFSEFSMFTVKLFRFDF